VAQQSILTAHFRGLTATCLVGVARFAVSESQVAVTDTAVLARPRPPVSGIAAWVMFDWASQPFFTLVSFFVFGPYFAAHVAADPVEGQALWGYATAAAGVVIAACSPVFGSMADAGGPRKPWIAVFSVLLVAGSVALWFTEPGAANAVTIALVAFAVGTVGAEFAAVFTNAMMPDLVDEKALGRLSGIGWSVGYVGGLISLFITLGFFASQPDTGLTLLGVAPILGLDPATFEGDRASGPFTAIWYLIFVLPLFLFTPDAPRRMGLGAALHTGFLQLWDTVVSARRHANAFRFLIANMVYTDGLIALTVFGGIYASGTFGWSSIELGVFGIVITLIGAIGALIGGWLDDKLGPKRVIQGSLVLFILAAVGILSIDATHVGFFWEVAPPAEGDGLFVSVGEKAYLVMGALIGSAAGPLWASSRTLLCRVAPRERITQFFGLYAMTGKATSWAGPLFVGLVTTATDSQRWGISVLVLFFAAGFVLIAPVREGRD
jgi:UMF1 family MFS transporter